MFCFKICITSLCKPFWIKIQSFSFCYRSISCYFIRKSFIKVGYWVSYLNIPCSFLMFNSLFFRKFFFYLLLKFFLFLLYFLNNILYFFWNFWNRIFTRTTSFFLNLFH
jgi:hypothetical protein